MMVWTVGFVKEVEIRNDFNSFIVPFTIPLLSITAVRGSGSRKQNEMQCRVWEGEVTPDRFEDMTSKGALEAKLEVKCGKEGMKLHGKSSGRSLPLCSYC